MLTRIQPTTLHQIVSESMLYSEISVKRILGPDDTCKDLTFEGDMLIENQPKTLLQIFNEFMLNFKIIVKKCISPDDICQNFWHKWVNSLKTVNARRDFRARGSPRMKQ